MKPQTKPQKKPKKPVDTCREVAAPGVIYCKADPDTKSVRLTMNTNTAYLSQDEWIGLQILLELAGIELGWR